MAEPSPRSERFRRPDEYEDSLDSESLWAEIRPRREPMQKAWFLPLILILLALSVPWYRKTGEIGTIVAGLPLWIWVSLLCSALVSLVTAVMAIFYWDDDEEEGGS